jgi:hypothetical protein
LILIRADCSTASSVVRRKERNQIIAVSKRRKNFLKKFFSAGFFHPGHAEEPDSTHKYCRAHRKKPFSRRQFQ